MVSIVLPTYNREKYLIKSIQSIVNQTYREWELIIIDDCSTDNTYQIATEFTTQDSRIQVIHNTKNKKLPASLNIGFRQAKGKYFTWTSDDNMYHADALEKMVEYLDSNKEKYLVAARMKVIDENGESLSPHYIENTPQGDELIYFTNPVCACFMYRREVLDTVGEYNENLFCLEDYDYWVRLAKHYGEIGYIEERLYDYRMHSESLTSTKEERIKKLAIEAKLSNLEYLLNVEEKKPVAITALFCFMLSNKISLSQEQLQKIYQSVPELELIDLDNYSCDRYLIYGAGMFGRRLRQKLGEHAYWFIDSNPRLHGQEIDGVPVHLLKEADNLIDSAQICVAVSLEKVYSVLKSIKTSVYKRCTVCFQLYDDFV